MRSLLIDELTNIDIEKITRYLNNTLKSSNLKGVYWLIIPPILLNDEQIKHKNCSPYQVAIIIENKSLRLEFLIRGAGSLHCTCITYATHTQRTFIIKYLDQLIEKLDLKI